MILRTLPVLGDNIATETGVEDGSTGSDFNLQAFLDSSTGQNLVANLLNTTAGQGKSAIFRNPNGTYSTATQTVDPLWIIGGAVALGLILYFGKK